MESERSSEAQCQPKALHGPSYNKSRRDALFLNFILVKNSICFGQNLLSIIRSLYTVFTAIGICHASYFDCLLARSGPDLEVVQFHSDCLEAVIKNLHETYQCRMYSRKLLMMGREDARNM